MTVNHKHSMSIGEVELCKRISEWGAMYLQLNSEFEALQKQYDNMAERRKTACEEFARAIEEFNGFNEKHNA